MCSTPTSTCTRCAPKLDGRVSSSGSFHCSSARTSPSVVAEELFAGALDAPGIALVDRHLGALRRAGRVVAPSTEDWIAAGKLIAKITQREPDKKSKVQQQLLNDILIALSARRIGATVFTFNRDDFELIGRHRSFSLEVLGPA